MVEFSPATRETGVRFPANATFFLQQLLFVDTTNEVNRVEGFGITVTFRSPASALITTLQNAETSEASLAQ